MCLDGPGGPHDLRRHERQKTYPTPGGDATSDERNKTDESPVHTAIVLVPHTLLAKQPIQVILQFHGWGFRSGDPYAGYLKGKDKGNTYRDIEQEHLDQQIGPLEAQVAGGPPQIVGILAQGIGTAQFGSMPTFDFIRDVLTKSGRFSGGLPEFSVVLSAHSGGGSHQVVPDLSAGQADTSDRSLLSKQTASAAVPGQWQQAVHDLFRIIRVTDPSGRNDPKVNTSPRVEHEEVISGNGAAKDGSMAAALKASRDPTTDRADDVQNETPPAREEKQSEKAPAKRAVQKSQSI